MQQQLAELPFFGVGLSLQPEARPLLDGEDVPVQCLEIITEHFLEATPEKAEELAGLARRFPLLPHGLTLSIGSADGLDDDYLRRLARWVDALHPPLYSEHLAFTHAGGLDAGHFLPLPFTREAVDLVACNARRVQRALGVPLLLENVACLFHLPGAEMDEPEFLTCIAEEADCGLLLDLTNLHANAVNLGFDASDFLHALPHERVGLVHLSGGRWEDGLLVDSHSTPVPEPVWDLLDETLRLCPIRALILERDGNFAPTAEIAADLRRAQRHVLTAESAEKGVGNRR